jgi:antitoxin ParD1/3/4
VSRLREVGVVHCTRKRRCFLHEFRPLSIPMHRHRIGTSLLAIFANRAMIGLEIPPIERAAAVPTRNVNLTEELDHFVAKKVKSGRYENASEVVRAGLRTLEREEQQYEAKLAALRAAIDEGDASGIAEGNVFGRVRKSLKLPVSR